jgi:CubicO group peptidase (beta-lactamase class C family)
MKIQSATNLEEANSEKISSQLRSIPIYRQPLFAVARRAFWQISFCLVLLCCGVTLSYAQAWQARHGLTSAQYQSEFNNLVSQGYRLTYVSGYGVNNQERFAAIWEKKLGPAWVTHHGMTSAQYQAAFNQYVSQGYRLTLVNGYTVNDQDRYVAIWEKKTGPAWVAHHGMTSAQYQQAFNNYTSQGYRLSHVSGYAVNDQARYAAFWEKESGPAWVARHGMTSAQYQNEFDNYTGLGYRLTHVSAYDVNGTDYYAAIWEKTTGPAWVARHRLTSGQYQAEFTDRAIQGYRLKEVNGYAIGLSARYAAIWEAGANALTGTFCQNGQCFDLERFADNIENALQGQKVVKYGFEVRRGLSVIQRANGPKRTEADMPASDFTVFDRFNPASVSKSITAVATLQLLAEKRISIDAHIYHYLPTNWDIPASSKTITFKEVLNHTSGLRGENAGGQEYEHMKALIEHGINLADKVSEYENVNYALLRILVASLDGFDEWNDNPGPQTCTRFIAYVNREIFSPLGIYNVQYKPAAVAPTLFYPYPVGDANGTAYGDWSNKPGAAGAHTSVHELTIFTAATFNGMLLPNSMISALKEHGLGLGDYGEMPDGGHAWGKGGYFPAAQNGGAELNSVIVHFDSGVEAMLIINGEPSAKSVLVNAYKAAFIAP